MNGPMNSKVSLTRAAQLEEREMSGTLGIPDLRMSLKEWYRISWPAVVEEENTERIEDHLKEII